MHPIALLEKYYPPGSDSHRVLLRHSIAVAEKAVHVALHVATQEEVDLSFVEEAALLHDIGICRTAAPDLGCHGDLPYLCHGREGRSLLEAEGLPRHALVCERHIGVGLTAAEIRAQQLPLPHRDAAPLSLEERIVTYADLFFSKSGDGGEKPPAAIRTGLARFGADKVATFDDWHARFAP